MHAKEAAIIIDIDDTLMDTTGRFQEILLEVGSEHNIPQLTTLEAAQIQPGHCWMTCGNVGLNQRLIKQICGDPTDDTTSDSFWGKKFFLEPSYLQYDYVIPGSTIFITRLRNELPVHIVYLSGRMEKYLLDGTIKQLEYHNFPLSKTGDKFSTTIILKPENVNNNMEFKKQVIARLQDKYHIIAAIDDNLRNVNMFREMLSKDAIVIRLNHDVSDSNGMEANIVQITNFSFNVHGKGAAKDRSSNQTQLEKIFQRLKYLASN